MKTLSEKFQRTYGSGLPMVIYRKPDTDMVRGLFAKSGEPHPVESDGFLFHSFAGNASFFLAESACEIIESESENESFQPATPELTIDAEARSTFEKQVAEAVQAINEGAFRKVVLSRKESFATELSPFEIFERLLVAYPNAFVSLWSHPETGCWIGATPERLVSGNGSTFKTMALAGTQAFQGEDTMEWPVKEREEQRLVTDYIWQKLEPLCASVDLSAPFTKRAGNLLHICTDVSGVLADGVALDEVAPALHPTPAVCGLPKGEALKFILENEGYDREFYAGFLGERSSDKTDLFVNLRCMKWSPGKAELFMGCGITSGSEPEKEFFETVNKSLTIRKVL